MSDRIRVKPTAVRRAAIARPAAAVVSAVAPGHRSWDTIAIRPPGRMRRWTACDPASGSRHMPMVFTAKTLSNGAAHVGSCSAAPRRSTTCPARSAAALRRLPDHDGRVIDAAHKTARCPAAQLPDGDSRSEADLQNAVAWLDPEQADGPHVALAVRRPQRHLPPDEPACEPAGLHELRSDCQRQRLLPVHDRSQLPFESLEMRMGRQAAVDMFRNTMVLLT